VGKSLEERVTAIEERLGMEAGLRASQDRDLGLIAERLSATNHMLQALGITQGEHFAVLASHTTLLGRHADELSDIRRILVRHEATLETHTKILDQHSRTLEHHTTLLESIVDKVDRLAAR
jgi:hypothetical protein